MTDLPRIERILERQAKSWQLRRRLAGEGGEAAREALLHLKEGPWITISRQRGSGGQEVAHAVGRDLGWQVFDNEILNAIAKNTKTREFIFSRLEEGVLGPFRDFISQLVVPGDPGQVAYLRELTQVVWGLAKQGQAVIVGRGANWFLDARFGLRVRIIDSLERRVARVVEEQKLSAAEARGVTVAHDEQRRSFVRRAFGRNIDDPSGYDLVVNLESLEQATAVNTILAALRSKLG